MAQPLFLQATPPSRLEEVFRFLETFWPVLLPAVVGLAAVYLMLPRARRYPPLWGGVAAGLGLALAGWLLIRTEAALPETVLFYSFAGIAVVAGGLLVTLTNPVHAALSFALVVLSSCGLFLLQGAPFLMAATIIIYAGAIIVTFLFVIMLAQQEGVSSADRRSREPFLATVAGFVLLGALLCVLRQTYEMPTLDELLTRADRASRLEKVEEIKAALGGLESFQEALLKLFPPEARESGKGLEMGRPELAALYEPVRELSSAMQKPSVEELQKLLREIHAGGLRVRLTQGSLRPGEHLRPGEKLPLSTFSGAPASVAPPVDDKGRVKERLPAENVAALGRALFSDYLLAVELASVLLLVAVIGAVAIAGRRTEGWR